MFSSKKVSLNRAFFVGLFLLGLGLYYLFETPTEGSKVKNNVLTLYYEIHH